MDYIRAFIVGGLICVIGQLLMDGTKLTPAHVLVAFVTSGVILTAIGIYEPIVNIGGAGATVPLPGFGYSLAKGVFKAVNEDGLIGVFTGGMQATAGGVSAAIFFGYIMSLIFNPKSKS
ncbi:stage V sporulation protein AEB [Caloranaerobacter azorensis H53214]|uniref:Stage V sporulation protein AEB n=1 Tax=Caloranaerobacter azorensis H53214 TaxID=1156417 RepID=A0A096BJ06_9FIRM|nr:stage V sporulation protein AE [Caloranaerobacter azorensis]KGG81160.1 stage V sporulation protein AEB [Caloranaerobacter azorensis H53214]